MTNQEIRAKIAGFMGWTNLHWVEEKAMGRSNLHGRNMVQSGDCAVPEYDTQMEALRPVIEKVCAGDPSISLNLALESEWTASFAGRESPPKVYRAASPMIAVCKAVLGLHDQ
jgi:hypothetical protein